MKDKTKVKAKNVGGRPTDYKKEYCEDIVHYFKISEERVYEDIEFYKASDEQVKLHITNPDKDKEHIHGSVKHIKYKGSKVMIPTFERWCSNIGIHKDTLYQWAKVHTNFSDSLAICKQIQEAILMECGLSNIFNPAITQLMLKNNHGWKDKTEVEQTTIVKIGDMTFDSLQ